MPVQLACPTPADVAAIAACADPVLRNLLITECYHELALALRVRTGQGANWCTFATWASRQAGRTIRGEDLRETLRARLEASPDLRGFAAVALPAVRAFGGAGTLTELVSAVGRALELEGALQRAATAVAAGNLKVFAEIADLFARLLALAPDEPADTFLAGLHPGDPPEGQRLLREAFEAYLETMRSAQPGERAQLLYYANLLVGLHEQTRLQPEIAAAMNAAIDEDAVRARVVRALLPGFWIRIRYRVAALFGRRPPLDELLTGVVSAAQQELRLALTGEAMTLALPAGVTVYLGHDLTVPHAASLLQLTEPRLAQLIRRIDPRPDTPAGGGARDWSVLEQRLHLIADLFRCYHDWLPLFDPPFTAEQLARLRAGTLPDPPL